MSHSYKHFSDYIDRLLLYGDKTALNIKPFLHQERTTFKQLYQRAHQTARFLQAQNVQRGDRIMIIAGNSPSWVKLFLGAQLMGVIVVPVDVTSSLSTVSGYINLTDPKLIFKGRHVLSDLSEEPRTIIIDELDSLTGDYEYTPIKNPAGVDSPAVMVFTSGTTADPKGVVLTQANILSNVQGVRYAIEINPRWRFLSILPLSHMYELTAGCLAVLSGGASVYYMTQVAPSAITRALNDYKITSILAVPQLAVLFLQKIKQTAAQQGQLATLRIAFKAASVLPYPARRMLFHKVHKNFGGHLQFFTTGGAPMPLDVAKKWELMGVKILQGYGLTETAPVLTINSFKQRRLDSPGRVISGSRIRIAQDGEIVAKGPNVFKEYWRNPAATKAAFTSDGWFRTGDVGEIKDGWLFIKGRSRFKIVLASGLKVFPEDIEAVAVKLPALGEVCVIAHKQADGETVRAVILSDRSDEEISRAIESLNARLESFQHISDWVRWPDSEFPRTRLLKIDRRKVESAFSSESSEKTNADSGSTTVDPVASILRLALNDPTLKIEEDSRLSTLGLDSLRRLSVVSLIEERLGISIAEASINGQTTLKQLRELIEQSKPLEPPLRPSDWQYNPLIKSVGMFVRETFVRFFLRIWVKQRTEGKENLSDMSGPALFIFNHVDGFDAPVVFKALPYRIRNRLAVATAADVMEEHILLRIFSPLLFAGFALSRKEPYMPSLEYAAGLIDDGWNIALAPEGRVSENGKLQQFKSGIGLLAVESGVPVVPVKTIGLYGTVPLHHSWPVRRSDIVVRIGRPIRFSHSTSYDDATRTLRQAVKDL